MLKIGDENIDVEGCMDGIEVRDGDESKVYEKIEAVRNFLCAIVRLLFKNGTQSVFSNHPRFDEIVAGMDSVSELVGKYRPDSDHGPIIEAIAGTTEIILSGIPDDQRYPPQKESTMNICIRTLASFGSIPDNVLDRITGFTDAVVMWERCSKPTTTD